MAALRRVALREPLTYCARLAARCQKAPSGVGALDTFAEMQALAHDALADARVPGEWIARADVPELAELLAVSGFFVVCEGVIVPVVGRLVDTRAEELPLTAVSHMLDGSERWGLAPSGDDRLVLRALSAMEHAARRRSAPAPELVGVAAKAVHNYSDADGIPSEVDRTVGKCLRLVAAGTEGEALSSGWDAALWDLVCALAPTSAAEAKPVDVVDVTVARWPLTCANLARCRWGTIADLLRGPRVPHLHRWATAVAATQQVRALDPGCLEAQLEDGTWLLPTMQLHPSVQLAELLLSITSSALPDRDAATAYRVCCLALHRSAELLRRDAFRTDQHSLDVARFAARWLRCYVKLAENDVGGESQRERLEFGAKAVAHIIASHATLVQETCDALRDDSNPVARGVEALVQKASAKRR